MNKKVGMLSLGCPKNLVDSEVMLGILRRNGYEITNFGVDAQIIIVNTCGFIQDAKQESINTILEMAQYKVNGKCEKLIVTGCLAERYGDMIFSEIPEVDAVVGTGDFGRIDEIINDVYSQSKTIVCGNLCGYYEGYLDRIVSTNFYAYIKIAEGCNNCCTFCIIPKLRGPLRSRKIEHIVEEARHLVNNGISELILVAQDTTIYGVDIYNKNSLVDLLVELEKIDGVKRIRIMYCYPEGISDELITVIAESKKVCKYLDIPIQHSSNNVLKRMGRKGNIDYIHNLIVELRRRIPGLVLRTSLITGFPGETEQDFKLLQDFVKKIEFERLGVFAYSAEEGTAAERMSEHIPAPIKNLRRNKIMKIQKHISSNKNFENIGAIYNVLVEGVADDGIFYYGRSYADSPEIDGKVFFTAKRMVNLGEYLDVKILDCTDYDLIGEEVGD